MSDTPAVHGSARRRLLLRIGFVVAAIVVAVLGTVVVWRRGPRGQVANILSEPLSEVQKAMSEASRVQADGTALSTRFVNDLRAGRWHEAHQATTRRFRQKMDEASFERFVKESPPLDAPVAPVQFSVAIASGDTKRVDARGSAPKGGAWLLLVSEDGTLKVDRIALGDRLTP